mgnify:CR=1 FL=1
MTKNNDTENEQEVPVLDETTSEPAPHKQFSITSYGADYPVEALVSRMNKGDFHLPDFQRAYVWNLPQASRFIESLLLGLPIPSIFLFREESNKHLVIDGQQRLKTLQYFRNGTFKEKTFRLVEVSEPWNDKCYTDLPDDDRRRFDDALLHAIIFRQEFPEQDRSSIYEVFERLNSGGIKLSPQEIRICVSDGPFVKLIRTLNNNPDWRAIFGKQHIRGKDEELILRFLSLKFANNKYERPMKQFLDKFLSTHRNLPSDSEEKFSAAFEQSIAIARKAFGTKAFRPEKILNAAVFDSVMLGLSAALEAKPDRDLGKIRAAYEALLQNRDYVAAYSVSTADENQLKNRTVLATRAFSEC